MLGVGRRRQGVHFFLIYGKFVYVVGVSSKNCELKHGDEDTVLPVIRKQTFCLYITYTCFSSSHTHLSAAVLYQVFR